MKFLIYCLAPLLIGCFDQQSKTNSADLIQFDSSWKKKTISNVLTISLPDSAVFEQIGYVKANFNEGRSGFYGVDHYDTIFVYITNQTDFKNTLKGYLAVQFTEAQLIPCDLTAYDTTIGNSAGYFITGYSTDSLASCKYLFCYLTLANNNFYWFYACQSSPRITNETRQFFQSIQFKKENFKESDYQLPPTRIYKDANSATARPHRNETEKK